VGDRLHAPIKFLERAMTNEKNPTSEPSKDDPERDEINARVMESVRQLKEEGELWRIYHQATFTVPELAKLIGLSDREVRNLILDQAIAATRRPGGWWRISRDEVRRLVREHATARNCQAGLDYLAAVDAVERIREESQRRLLADGQS
jgi:excisionase family DNA binding protein